MVKKLSMLLVFFVSACVTVNIYFPAAAVQRAADAIVNETWGGPDKEEPRRGPKPAPGERGSLEPKIFAFAFAADAFAQEPDINVSNPSIRALKDSIRARSEAIKPFMDKGNVGINRDGLLTVRTTDGLNLKERA